MKRERCWPSDVESWVKEATKRRKSGETSHGRSETSQRERSETCAAEMPEITASAASFFFHPVTQIYVLTLLLSSFTHTHANARAYACKRVRERGGEKEERGSVRIVGLPATSPCVAPGGDHARDWPRSSPTRTRAPRGHTVPHVASANVAEPKTSGQPANRYSRAIFDGRGLWEHRRVAAQFVLSVRSFETSL